jgi:hypothetical protein
MNDVIGRYPDEVFVECAVVDAAEAQAVRYRRCTERVNVGDDVSRVKQS